MQDHRNANRLATTVNGSSQPRPKSQMTEERSLQAGSSGSATSEHKLSSEVRRHLGDRLRTVYASLISEPVPERFMKLLEELEATEKTS